MKQEYIDNLKLVTGWALLNANNIDFKAEIWALTQHLGMTDVKGDAVEGYNMGSHGIQGLNDLLEMILRCHIDGVKVDALVLADMGADTRLMAELTSDVPVYEFDEKINGVDDFLDSL